MTQGNATLVLDLGNSESRCLVIYGKDGKGRYREKYFELSNHFGFAEDDYKVPERYKEDTSTFFSIDAKVNGQPLVGNYANGELQTNEFYSSVLRPTAVINKYESTTSALTYALAMYNAHKQILAITRTTDFDQLDITWNVFVLLPPGHMTGAKNLIDIFKSITSLKFLLPNVTIPVKTNKFYVLSEGYCGYIAAVYDKGGVFRLGMETMQEEITLILDIGSGTTDMMIIEGNEPNEKTMHTIKCGGGNVVREIAKKLRVTYDGLILTDKDILKSMSTGQIKDGSKWIDISKIINTAKETIANELVSDAVAYFEEIQYPTRRISKLLVFGGGELAGEEESKVLKMSTPITNFIKGLSPNIEAIDLPTWEVQKEVDGEVIRITEEVSPRMLNIIGGGILSENYN